MDRLRDGNHGCGPPESGDHPYGRKLPDGSRLDGTNPDLFLERFFQRQGIDREQMGPAKIAEFVDNDFQAIAAAQQDRQTLEASLTLRR